MNTFSTTFTFSNQQLLTNFSLENGKEKLQTIFPYVERHLRKSFYLVDDYKLLSAYIVSSQSWIQTSSKTSFNQKEFINYCKKIVEKENNQFKVQIQVGYFIAKKS